jgi:CRISPR type III-A-associated RAMP protein Csm5
LSPIHVGSGNSYSPLEFLSPKAKDKKSGKEVRLLRRINFDGYYLDLSNDRKDEFLENVVDSNFKLNDFDNKIKRDFKKYDSINRSSNPCPNTVLEHIRTMNELFIPGSSLKGAIKTAILYDNISKDDIAKINGLIKSNNMNRNKNIVDRRKYSKFIDDIFASKSGGKSAQFNIFKFFQISDSTYLKLGEIHEVITLKAKKDPYPSFEQHKLRGNPVSSFLEVIPNKKLIKSKISTNYNEKNYKSLKLSEKSKMIDMDNIKKAIHKFSRDFIDNEMGFFEKYGQSKLDDHLLKFYEKLDKINKEDNPVIKIGFGSGFLSTTIGLRIKKYDQRLYDDVRKVAHRSYEYEYPKSRKISKVGMPLGWVELRID